MLKAIETEYKGRKFRSRLEARWAVFLDGIGVEWLYEMEGYQLESGWYLPDFYLPGLCASIKSDVGLGAYLEIKPPGDVAKHAEALERESGKPVLVSDGDPPKFTRGRLNRCAECNRLYADGPVRAAEPRLGSWMCKEKGHAEGLQRVTFAGLVQAATQAALSARFDGRRGSIELPELARYAMEPERTAEQIAAKRAALIAMLPEASRLEQQRIDELRKESQEIQSRILAASSEELDDMLRRKQEIWREIDRLRNGARPAAQPEPRRPYAGGDALDKLRELLHGSKE